MNANPYTQYHDNYHDYGDNYLDVYSDNYLDDYSDNYLDDYCYDYREACTLYTNSIFENKVFLVNGGDESTSNLYLLHGLASWGASPNKIPEIVETSEGFLDTHTDDKSQDDVKTVSYSKLTPYLVDTIQELTKRIEELEKKVK